MSDLETREIIEREKRDDFIDENGFFVDELKENPVEFIEYLLDYVKQADDMIDTLCDSENQPHQFVGDPEMARQCIKHQVIPHLYDSCKEKQDDE